ncbi:MAG TPA: hypothetical protein VEL31_00095 [Ktedonobacteraceae bacterium]|nr:hypothetical protein [Ktedonobacteraceae bacterium]
MASKATIFPELEQGIETQGIERVAPGNRGHIRIFDNHTMWLSSNLVISSVALGALAKSVFALGFWDSVIAIDDWNAPGKLPFGWAAIVSLLIGLGGALLGAAQADYIGPIALWLSHPYGMDVGFELGVILAGVAYFFLRRFELALTSQ